MLLIEELVVVNVEAKIVFSENQHVEHAVSVDVSEVEQVVALCRNLFS